MLPGFQVPLGMLTAEAAPAVCSFLWHDSNEADQSNYSFSGRQLGAAAADRCIVVGVGTGIASGSQTADLPTGVTIGGVPASQLVGYKRTPHQGVLTLWAALVPSGTSGTVTVNHSSTQRMVSVGAWRITGLKSLVPVQTKFGNGANFSGVETKKGGVVIALAVSNNTVSAITHSWTGATENYDAKVENWYFTGAFASDLPKSANYLVSAAASGGGNGELGILASLR